MFYATELAEEDDDTQSLLFLSMKTEEGGLFLFLFNIEKEGTRRQKPNQYLFYIGSCA